MQWREIAALALERATCLVQELLWILPEKEVQVLNTIEFANGHEIKEALANS